PRPQDEDARQHAAMENPPTHAVALDLRHHGPAGHGGAEQRLAGPPAGEHRRALTVFVQPDGIATLNRHKTHRMIAAIAIQAHDEAVRDLRLVTFELPHDAGLHFGEAALGYGR